MSAVRIIAIDGPAGSGKSTISRALAEALGLATLDTGASYRAVTAAALRSGIDPSDPRRWPRSPGGARLEIDGGVGLDGVDVGRGDPLRARSTTPSRWWRRTRPVRAVLVEWQRAWVASHGGGVVEGRDIGSVVFPDATVKLYLTASADERARRRAEEGAASVERRDRLDSTAPPRR